MRTHPDDKLFAEQHCYKSAAGLLQPVRLTRLLSSRYRVVFALLVPMKLLSPCYRKVDDGDRLATSCSNKTDTGRNKLARDCWQTGIN